MQIEKYTNKERTYMICSVYLYNFQEVKLHGEENVQLKKLEKAQVIRIRPTANPMTILMPKNC